MECVWPNDVHKPKEIQDNAEVVEAYCVKCKAHAYFRKDSNGRIDPAYAKFFRADTLQPSQNLYYRIHPQKMSVAL